jgi:hypothetical protein
MNIPTKFGIVIPPELAARLGKVLAAMPYATRNSIVANAIAYGLERFEALAPAPITTPTAPAPAAARRGKKSPGRK